MSKHLPYMTIFVSDFALKTGHLTFAELGVYMRLISLCWSMPGCTIPDDEKWISRHLRITESCFNGIVAPVLEEFFKVENSRVFEPDLLVQWGKSKTSYDNKVEAGRKGGKASQKTKSLKNNDLDSSNAQATITRTITKTIPITKTNIPISLQEEKTLNPESYSQAKAIDDEPFKRSVNG